MGADFNQVQLFKAAANLPNLIIVDLTDTETAEPRFWLTLHVTFPTAQLMALVEQPLSDTALQAALTAGVHCFALWTDTSERWHEAIQTVNEGRRFYSAGWLIGAAQKVIKDVELGIIQFKSSRVDPAEFESRYNLTQLEAKLLTYLVRNEGNVIALPELAREVWEQESGVGDVANQVNCCIRRLRGKLATDSQNRYQIEAVRGRGYRLRQVNVDTPPKN